jgi:hypothetical protein
LDERVNVVGVGVLNLRVERRWNDGWVKVGVFVRKMQSWESQSSWYHDLFWAVAVEAVVQLPTDVTDVLSWLSGN